MTLHGIQVKTQTKHIMLWKTFHIVCNYQYYRKTRKLLKEIVCKQIFLLI